MGRKLLILTLLMPLMAMSPSAVIKIQDRLQPIEFENITLMGELFQRITQNMDRLEHEKYQPHKVFLTNEQSMYWPGDTEGRTILALTLDAQVLKKEPRYLAEIIRMIKSKTNKKGYFGDMYSDSLKISEQQLSSHGWVLRGLCEYYKWKKDPEVLKYIEKIVNNLVIPTLGMHSTYPIDPDKRTHGGSHSGTQQASIGPWILSTDIGCDHILLDGIAQAYEIMPKEKLRSVIEEMINVFLQIDQVKIKAQTHATLTAMRGLLRWSQMMNRNDLVQVVENKWTLYKKQGMTENYENYNWFGRPDWTEPCAVVDSYMIAVMLWQLTGKSEYLEDAHHIYYNGLGVEQRANGGFGIQNCSGAKNNPNVEATLQEAHWCCTMRGGEGLSRVAQHTYFYKSNPEEIALPFYQNSIATIKLLSGYVKLQEITDYPYSGNTILRVVESTTKNKVTLKLYLPPWMNKPVLSINNKEVKFAIKNGFAEVKTELNENTIIEMKTDITFGVKETINENSVKGYHSFTYGPMLLGYQGADELKLSKKTQFESKGNGTYVAKDNNVTLTPLFHLLSPEVSVDNKYKRQILFKQD